MGQGGMVRDLTSQDWSTCSFAFANPRGVLTPFILSGAWRDQPVQVHLASIQRGDYAVPGYAVDGYFAQYSVTTMLLFEGVLSAAPERHAVGNVPVRSQRRAVRAGVARWQTVFNHLPVPDRRLRGRVKRSRRGALMDQYP